jgi:hypothetical protein
MKSQNYFKFYIFFRRPCIFKTKVSYIYDEGLKQIQTDQDALRCWNFLSHRHTDLKSYNVFHCPLFIEYARACSTYDHILSRGRLLTGKLMIQ